MLHLEIVTPEGTTYNGKVDSVTIPTVEGEITVLANHIPLIGVIRAGTLVLKTGKEEQLIAVSRGMVEVTGTHVKVLTDTADRADMLQEEAIQKAKDAAEKLLAEKRHDAEGFAEATAILDRELARLHTVRKHRSRRGLGSTSVSQ